jgi:hypothetical protein
VNLTPQVGHKMVVVLGSCCCSIQQMYNKRDYNTLKSQP